LSTHSLYTLHSLRLLARAPCSFLLVAHMTKYTVSHLVVNLVVLGVLLVAKLPEMHGVRIFAINKAPTDAE